MKRYASFFLLIFLACCNSPQKEEEEIMAFYDTIRTGDRRLTDMEDGLFYPRQTGWVSDFSEIFSEDEKNTLGSIINNYRQQTTNEISIVTIPASYFPSDSLEAYSMKLFNRWGIGTKEKNNGVGIIICVQNRKMRIETGKGLLQVLTNEKAKTIIDSSMLPFFKNAHYFEGVIKGITEIISIIGKGE